MPEGEEVQKVPDLISQMQGKPGILVRLDFKEY